MGKMTELEQIRAKLKQFSHPEKIAFLKNYMTTPYNYLYGISVPDMRKIAKEINLDFIDTLNLFEELWNSGNHEEMNVALYLIHKYRKKHGIEIWNFLVPRIEKARTWDHVDELGMHTIGEILAENINLIPIVKKWAESRNPWMRRLSVVCNYPLIKKNKLELTFLLAEKLVYDEDKFVQKGAGWMLREAGKRNRFAVRDFILNHLDMKNIAFSYATEKMKELRKIRKEKIKRVFYQK